MWNFQVFPLLKHIHINTTHRKNDSATEIVNEWHHYKSLVCIVFPNDVFAVVCHGSSDTSYLSLYTSPKDPQFGRRIEQKGNFNNLVRNFKIMQISMDSFQLSPNAWNVFSMYVYPLYSTGWFSLPPPHQAISSWNIYSCGPPRG